MAGEVPRGSRGLQHTIDEDAALDGIGPWWSRFYAWWPLASLVALMAVYVVHRPSFYWFLREDRPMEWAQFALCSFASIIGFLAAVRLMRRGHLAPAAVLILLSLMMLGLAGEEISWGQRVFGVETPTDWSSGNRQGETNFHNTKVLGLGISADLLSELLELGIGLTGLGLSLLARRPEAPLRYRTWRLVMPPLFTVPGFALMALYQLGMQVIGETISPAILLQEWAEVSMYMCIAVTVLLTYAKYGRMQSTSEVVDVTSTPVPMTMATSTDRLIITAILTIIFLVTIAFAISTAVIGMVPGNVPPGFALPPLA
jgi:hypothetical protein